jgi:ribosomal protein S27AE
MPSEACPNCGDTVSMKRTVHSGRKWCPHCRVVQGEFQSDALPTLKTYNVSGV